MAAVGHFGCPKFTFDRISGHFRSILNFSFLKFLTKWLPSAILDVRNSLSIAFLAISDQYSTFFFEIFDIMAAVGHFGCPKFTFDRISGHFRSIRNFIYYILDWTTMSVIELVRDIWMTNACVKFEERSLNPSKVIALTTKL